MMTLTERLRTAYRAFVTGHLDLTVGETWGHDDTQFSPPEYGDYLATSNGVYACSRLRAQMLSGLELKAYKRRNGETVEIEQGPLVDVLHKVNPFWTMNRLLEMTEMSLCAWGESYWFMERGLSGRQTPREIWWGKPDQVRVVPHEQNYISHFIYTGTNGQELTFAPWETIWLRYPNPLDQFSGLSPLAAARLAADSASAAMQSNLKLFVNGLQVGGFLMPNDKAITYTDDQAKQLERDLEKRFKGVDKAHRWAVLRFHANLEGINVNPKDAEFLGLLKWTLEDICRAYGVPLDLIGGERTYQNVGDARRAIWTQTLLPECRFIASELTEQLAPMFPGQVDEISFDTSNIEELHEAETDKWLRDKERIQVSAITINEWRTEYGLDPVTWGDLPYYELRGQAANPFGDMAQPPQETLAEPETALRSRALTRNIEFGSPEHERLWLRFVRRSEPYEIELGRVVEGLFERQLDSMREKLKQRSFQRITPEDLLGGIFDMAKWIKAFRIAVRPMLRRVAESSGQDALDDLAVLMSFNVDEPLVVRFLERRSQRFAERVNETTWDQLKKSLAEGLDAGDGMNEFADRVAEVMGDRIRSSKEAIARTEVSSVLNGATQEAWKQSGVVASKTWLAALDPRTRETHVYAHGQTVPLENDFIVGAGHGPTPGQIGLAEEDINCFIPDTIVQGAIIAASKAWYSGPVWEIKTLRGNCLTVTPNHPVLTTDGFVPACQLAEGMNLLSYSAQIGNGFLRNIDHQNGPSIIKDVFDTFAANGRSRHSVLVALDLHGDAIYTDGKINIVMANGILPTNVEPQCDENSGEIEFIQPSGSRLIAEEAKGASDFGLSTVGPATTSHPSSLHLSLNRGPVLLEDGPLEPLRLGLSAQWDVPITEQARQGGAGMSTFIRQLLEASSGLITFDEIISIREFQFSNHVYDLQSIDGWIIAQNIVTSNCRCTLTAKLK